ncbi:PD-(D/E)XK nuclease family protein [Rhodopirellula sp. JC740]|uniref:PD-(D/E)XK nuclease family protein n=1 Tax=Rhodopirellula halodulae TaxID=2894198 RepID=A0ABS8NLH1_9BACT|nr:PD-(D/E)XK nuclease family protein [Rhodopirellula sp. JC740]MCC9643331.1 PD-(D/E)XK nuclease family protein [Rhodopirellula sp. JC740]
MPQTIFLGWNRPLLASTAAWLKEHWLKDNSKSKPTWDLSQVDLVFPSRRAIDRMRERLQEEAVSAGVRPQLPRMVTVGDLPSRLYESRDTALDFEQTLAWARVLSSTAPEDLSALVATPPASDAADAWLELGGTMRRLHNSIAAEGLTYTDVLGLCDGKTETRRWQLFLRLMQQYQAELQSAGKTDPNEAELEAIRQRACRTNRSIVLVGTTDMSKLLVRMLNQVQSSVTALVAAPESEAHRFDRYGNLVSAQWQSHHLPYEPTHLIPAGEISDQTAAIVETLAEFGQSYRTDQITIGVTDESQVDPIENRCQLLNVETHRHLGHRVGQTAIGRLMHLVVTYLQRRTWRSLAALVRHADVTAFVSNRLSNESTSLRWLRQLDQLLSSAFPRSVDEPLPEKVPQSRIATEIRDVLDQWLQPLLASDPKPIRDWSVVVQGVLATLHGDVGQQLLLSSQAEDDSESVSDDATTSPDPQSLSRTHRALQAVFRLLNRFADLSPSLDEPVEGSVAMEMLASRIREVRWVDERMKSQVEILGWLDLALDDSPALVVCGLNHPFVPEAQSGDPFLPKKLRSTLHQSANQRRYARDVHAMQQLLSSRESVRFIVGAHSADGSPTPPSRLLSAASPEDSARLVCDVLTQPRPKIRIEPAQPKSASAQTPVDIERFYSPPPPEPGRTIQTLSVTAFSAYLACPYRFYLRHVLKLRPLDDSPLELAANQFGDLVHGALENFGESDFANETDPKHVEEALLAELHQFAAMYFGDNTSTTVKLQVRQAQRRLKTVALRQAERAAAGWKIHAVEASVDEKKVDEKGNPKKPTGILLDGEFTGLRGRFDRIDHHPETGRWAILDYKTHGYHPEKKHLKKQPDGSTQWVDLQLPLYRRFIPDLGIDASPDQVDLGYFNVAEKDTETQINLAEFSDSQFAAADELIHHCVREIRACHFEPNPEGVEFDDYEMMMNQRVFVPMDEEESFE